MWSNVDGVLCLVRFALPRAFTAPAESRWTTMHQELFAVKWGLEQFRSYILGRRVKVVTDHANLKWLTTMAPQQAKVARWCMSMAEFDFFIEHRKGERNIVPNVLSRHPVKENIPENNVVIPPENAVIAFIIIATSVDVPNHTPELVHGTFNNTMACLHNACPPTNGFDTVCLVIAPKRAKRAKEPQVKNSTTNQTKTPEVGKGQENSSGRLQFSRLLKFRIFKRQSTESIEFCKATATGLLVQSVNQVPYLKTRFVRSQEYSKGTFPVG